MYLDYATRQARRHIPMTMEDWKTKLDAFLRFNDAEVLQGKGREGIRKYCKRNLGREVEIHRFYNFRRVCVR